MAITQHGVTWTFDRAYESGTFANGDHWVVGPVKIVAIDPPTSVVNGRTINGSMINPTTDCTHGYDSDLYSNYKLDLNNDNYYRDELNVAIGVSASKPLELAASTSLISSISKLEDAQYTQLATATVLTVLSAPAPSGAFRPPYAGADKTIRHRESELDYGTLEKAVAAPDAPSLEETANGFSRVWLDHCAGWISSQMHPSDNMPGYYREFTALTGKAALLLNSNYTNDEKRDLLVGFVQRGLDDFGNIEAGARWYVNGHNNGRKFPILFAGRVLDDTTMLDVGKKYEVKYFGPNDPRNVRETFSEDGQTFYVAETSPGIYNWGFGGYSAQQVGVAEWGNFHTENPSSDSVEWEANPYRRCCSANAWDGVTLAMRMMDLKDAWHHDSFFDYMDRYKSIEQEWSTWDEWTGRMWSAYRAQY